MSQELTAKKSGAVIQTKTKKRVMTPEQYREKLKKRIAMCAELMMAKNNRYVRECYEQRRSAIYSEIGAFEVQIEALECQIKKCEERFAVESFNIDNLEESARRAGVRALRELEKYLPSMTNSAA